MGCGRILPSFIPLLPTLSHPSRPLIFETESLKVVWRLGGKVLLPTKPLPEGKESETVRAARKGLVLSSFRGSFTRWCG